MINVLLFLQIKLDVFMENKLDRDRYLLFILASQTIIHEFIRLFIYPFTIHDFNSTHCCYSY